ncbi:MAG TPA: RNA methyltransferase [Thermoanaerobaculia bacterium]|nr:RNA methyltransferase [Thermoanaerobaculia bacterium]
MSAGGLEIVAGFHPVREALRHRPHAVRRVLASYARGGQRLQEIEDLCRRHRVACERVPPAALAALGVAVHNGFAAELAPQPTRTTGGGGADVDLVVLLEDVQDPRNLGAILRVCDGAGVGRVLVRDRGSAPLTPAVARTAAGASEWVSLERVTNTAQELERLKKDGFWIYGAAESGVPPWQLELSGKVALCFGGEEKGLRQRTRDLCDGLVGLPMRGRVESLNVATAASALLYEAVRQRTSGHGRP